MLIRTDEDYASLVEAVHCADKVAVDTETNAKPVYAGLELRGVSIAIGEETWYLSVSHPGGPNFPVQPLLDALNESAPLILMHNSPYDNGVLSQSGDWHYPHGRLWDTQVSDWLLDENARSHRLKDIGQRYWGTDAKAEQKHLAALRRGRTLADLYKELREDPHLAGRKAEYSRLSARRMQPGTCRDWPTFTALDIHEYAEMDTRLTWDIAELHAGEVKLQAGEPIDVGPDVQREMDYQFMIFDMIRVGIKVNAPAAEAMLAASTQRLDEIQASLGDVNLNAPAQVAKLLYEEWGLPVPKYTDTGNPSTDKDALAELEGEHPGIDLILQYRQEEKMRSAYLVPLLSKRDGADRIHSAFSSARTVTGRLASSEPNLQTIPKESTNALVRSLFVPEPGVELWEFDLSQAELRVAAGFAQDVRLMEALEEGRDLHGEVVESIWGTEAELGPMRWEKYRTIGKNINYGYQYGMKARKLAVYLVKGTGLPVTDATIAEANSILAGYEATFPELARLMAGLARMADQHGYIPLHVPGRYRRYRGPKYHDRKTYTALNAIIQGGVAELMKDQHLLIHPWVQDYGRICLQVHDSFVMELEPGAGPVVHAKMQEMMDATNPFRMAMIWDAKQWGK